jgi:fused signal recognition particle receptor
LFNLFKKTEKAVQKSREGWFGKVARLFDRSRIDDELWMELEETLIAADVGVATTTRLLERVRGRLGGGKQGENLRSALMAEMVDILRVDGGSGPVNSRPRVVMVVGVNGSGKTTSIAKLAHSYQQEGQKVLLAAADTFRAAAIDQLRVWGQRMGVEVIAHQPGADPGAVVFDALEAARHRGMDTVIIDTAGRLHTKFNLMEELKKIGRVASKVDGSAPHEVLLVLDATTGQNGLAQARHFTEAVGVNAIFLAKLDGTARGGIVLAICDELKIPITFIGTGEGLDDLAPFDAQTFVEALCSP